MMNTSQHYCAGKDNSMQTLICWWCWWSCGVNDCLEVLPSCLVLIPFTDNFQVLLQFDSLGPWTVFEIRAWNEFMYRSRVGFLSLWILISFPSVSVSGAACYFWISCFSCVLCLLPCIWVSSWNFNSCIFFLKKREGWICWAKCNLNQPFFLCRKTGNTLKPEFLLNCQNRPS